jgi:hypothetical protein
MSETKSKTKNPVPEQLKATVFPKGVSGNPRGRRRTKPLTLSQEYHRQLGTVNPATGKTFAFEIAELIVESALTGDTAAIMVTLSNDSRGLVQSAVDSLVRASKVSREQANLALSLFIPERLI